MKKTAVAFLLLFSIGTLAATMPIQTIHGVVTGMNDKTVEVKTNQNTLIVPRKLVKAPVKMNDSVEISLSDDEIQQIKIKK